MEIPDIEEEHLMLWVKGSTMNTSLFFCLLLGIYVREILMYASRSHRRIGVKYDPEKNKCLKNSLEVSPKPSPHLMIEGEQVFEMS